MRALIDDMLEGIVVDLFAGGDGASIGIERALGRPVTVGVNHSPEAIVMHEANHPLAATRGRPVALLWASPDCKHFSKAKGVAPNRSTEIRASASSFSPPAAVPGGAGGCLRSKISDYPKFAKWRLWILQSSFGHHRRYSRSMSAGAVTLRELVGVHEHPSCRCDRCGRAGRYRLATLVREYGGDAGLPDVAAALEGGCPRKGQHGGCFVVWEDLV